MTTCWTLLPDTASSLLSTYLQMTVTQQKMSDNQKAYCVSVSAATSVRCVDSLRSIPCCSERSFPLRAGLQYLTVTLSWWVSVLSCRAREPSRGPGWRLQSLHTLFHHSNSNRVHHFNMTLLPTLVQRLVVYSPNSHWRAISFQAPLQLSF